MKRDGDLFEERKSTVGTLGRLGPTRTNALGKYPRPWYYTWDAPVWRVMAQDRTVAATCSDEAAAKIIVDARNHGLEGSGE